MLNRMYKDLHATDAKFNCFSQFVQMIGPSCMFQMEYSAYHNISEHNEYN